MKLTYQIFQASSFILGKKKKKEEKNKRKKIILTGLNIAVNQYMEALSEIKPSW